MSDRDSKLSQAITTSKHEKDTYHANILQSMERLISDILVIAHEKLSTDRQQMLWDPLQYPCVERLTDFAYHFQMKRQAKRYNGTLIESLCH